jgi:hypothetical protein
MAPIMGGLRIDPLYVKAATVAIAFPVSWLGKWPALLKTVGMRVDSPAPVRASPSVQKAMSRGRMWENTTSSRPGYMMTCILYHIIQVYEVCMFGCVCVCVCHQRSHTPREDRSQD